MDRTSEEKGWEVGGKGLPGAARWYRPYWEGITWYQP